MVRVLVLAGLVWVVIPSTSCTHEPFIVEPMDTVIVPIDTMDPGDTSMVGIPCNSEIVYFDKDVLPIFRGNCSIVGCHDAVTARRGVILDSYENIISTTTVTPFDLEETEIFERLTESDPDQRMPPFPREALDFDQLSIITKWILQGAEDLTCDVDTICEITSVSYSMDIGPIIERSCKGCHSGPNPVGGFSLDTYEQVAERVAAGRLYGAVAGLPGFVAMPLNQDRLPDCEIKLFRVWIDSGAMNN
jgi:hypothetical protein